MYKKKKRLIITVGIAILIVISMLIDKKSLFLSPVVINNIKWEISMEVCHISFVIKNRSSDYKHLSVILETRCDMEDRYRYMKWKKNREDWKEITIDLAPNESKIIKDSVGVKVDSHGTIVNVFIEKQESVPK